MFSKWGVELEGEADDLENMRFKINGSINAFSSLFVISINDACLLRSSLWDVLADPSEVKLRAVGQVSVIQGCINLLDGCGNIEVGTVYCFRPDGSFSMNRNTPLNIRVLKSRNRWSSPGEFSGLYRKALGTPQLEDAFRDFRVGSTWSDLYRTWEYLKIIFGGKHKLLNQLCGNDRRLVSRFTQTANSHRHAVYPAVQDPLDQQEAVMLVKKLMEKACETIAAPRALEPNFPSDAQVLLDNLDVPAGTAYRLNKLTLTPSSVREDSAVGSRPITVCGTSKSEGSSS